jgi:hypothetical protein
VKSKNSHKAFLVENERRGRHFGFGMVEVEGSFTVGRNKECK